MSETVGAFDAKTHLANLLDRAARGERFVITKHGRPVAELIPYSGDRETRSVTAVLDELNRIRDSIATPVDIRALRDEGRRR